MLLSIADCSGHLHPDFATSAMIAGLMGASRIAGKYIGDRVELTSLPQTVAAFHSLVGVAASAAVIGDTSRPSLGASPAPDPWWRSGS